LNASLTRLRELAPTLNQAADDAAKIVQQVENLLTKEPSLGIEARVLVSNIHMTPKTAKSILLAYCRVNGKYRIAVIEGVETEFTTEYGSAELAWNEETVTPWMESPRDTKLATFSVLPRLLQELVSNVSDTKAKVETTKQTVLEIMGGTSENAKPSQN